MAEVIDVPGTQRVVVGANAATDAQRFVAAAAGFDRTLTQLSATAAALANQQIWSGASADHFRAEQQIAAVHLRVIGPALRRMAHGAQQVIDRIDGADASGMSGMLGALMSPAEKSWLYNAAKAANMPLSIASILWMLGPNAPIGNDLDYWRKWKNLFEEDASSSDAASKFQFELKRQALRDIINGDNSPAKQSFMNSAQELASKNARDSFAAARAADEVGANMKMLKIAGVGGAVLTIASDADSAYIPSDKGKLGDVDRGAAIANGITTGLLAANAFDAVPVVGEVVLVADAITGAYLMVDTLANSSWFTNSCAAVGHSFVSAGKNLAHTVTSLPNSLEHGFGLL